MKRAVIYIHGKGGNVDEAKHYEGIFKGDTVIGFDYKAQTPWEAKKEFSEYFNIISEVFDSVSIIANSIGAYFSMAALHDAPIERAFFISPIVDMEKLIEDMMKWSGVTDVQLERQEEISTSFGETLSWEYLSYIRENPPKWDKTTDILYGSEDNLTSYKTILNFSEKAGRTLTVMDSGEHWFHTEEQMRFLDSWMREARERNF